MTSSEINENEAVCTTRTYATRELYAYISLVAGLVWLGMNMAAMLFPFKPQPIDLLLPVLVIGIGMYLLAKNKKEKEIL